MSAIDLNIILFNIVSICMIGRCGVLRQLVNGDHKNPVARMKTIGHNSIAHLCLLTITNIYRKIRKLLMIMTIVPLTGSFLSMKSP